MSTALQSTPAPRPAPLEAGARWRTTDLPPVLHTLPTADGRRMQVRLVRPGDAYGDRARLADPTLLLEVRAAPPLPPKAGPGDVLAIWDLTMFLDEPRAHWRLFGPGMDRQVDEDALHDLYATVHAAVTGHPA